MGWWAVLPNCGRSMRMYLPMARLNNWRSASSRAGFAPGFFFGFRALALLTQLAGDGGQVFAGRPHARRGDGLGAFRGLGTGAGVPSARGVGAVRVWGLPQWRARGVRHGRRWCRAVLPGLGGPQGASEAAASAPVSSCLGLSDGWPLGVSPGSGIPADGWRDSCRAPGDGGVQAVLCCGGALSGRIGQGQPLRFAALKLSWTPAQHPFAAGQRRGPRHAFEVVHGGKGPAPKSSSRVVAAGWLPWLQCLVRPVCCRTQVGGYRAARPYARLL